MKIHFIGIGGIGVSALAKYYLERGHKISGSDLVSSEIANTLQKSGAKIFTGQHKIENLPQNTDLLICSPAVPSNNVELKEAEKLQIKCLSYPQALGELTKKYFTIAISGTHGKSTTTAMTGLLLEQAGLDPTVIVGTKLKEWNDSNCRVGKSKYLIIEADEWQASFLNYWPKIIVLTNIEEEHMDYFKDLNHILKVFKEYIGHLPKEEVLVVNEDDLNINKLLKSINTTNSTIVENVVHYSLRQSEAEKIRQILKVPGEHNISNALAALTVARILKIPDEISFGALANYKGSWRRFDITKILYPKPYTLISDYAHHPTEIRVTLGAAREKFPKKKIWCIFQPHQYQRTYYLWDDFVKVFQRALQQTQGKPLIDKLIITDIYDVAGRENKEIKEKVSSEKLIRAINKSGAIYLPKEKIIEYLKKTLQGGEVVMVMGAGNIYKIVSDLQ